MPLYELNGVRPRIDPTAWIAPTAVIIGNVEVGPRASVWWGCTLRGDASEIRVGEGSNIQDGSVIHCSRHLPTLIGANVTIGHLACIEGCVVEDGALVGTAAVMLQRSRLGSGAMLAAGAVLGEGSEVPAGMLAAGVPAAVKKELSGSSAEWVARPAAHYRELAAMYREGLRPPD